jgi:hypothetical protein
VLPATASGNGNGNKRQAGRRAGEHGHVSRATPSRSAGPGTVVLGWSTYVASLAAHGTSTTVHVRTGSTTDDTRKTGNVS